MVSCRNVLEPSSASQRGHLVTMAPERWRCSVRQASHFFFLTAALIRRLWDPLVVVTAVAMAPPEVDSSCALLGLFAVKPTRSDD